MTPRPPVKFRDLLPRIAPHIVFILCLAICLLGVLAKLHGQEYGSDFRPSPIINVPRSVLAGIAMQETSSYYTGDVITYVNHRRGDAGEVGVFQMKRAAFAQVHLLPLMAEAARDPVCAEFCAIVYLRWCYRQTGKWTQAVAIYHTGPDGDVEDGAQYARDVEALGRRKF